MTKEQVIEKLVQLVKGELSPTDWLQWFEKYKDSIEGVCGRLRFLKMKPKESFSEIRNTYLSQITAYEWLKSIKITIDLSDNYKNDWEKEFENFVISKQKKTKNLKKTAKERFQYLQSVYPILFKLITQNYHQNLFISKGKSYNEIKEKENSLAIIFSEDIIEFFSTISKFQFEGISIHFDELAPINKEQLNLLILGEFWLYGDGDKIVYNSVDHKVYSFAHEYRPPQLIKIADSLKELVDKVFVKYLKGYEKQ